MRTRWGGPGQPVLPRTLRLPAVTLVLLLVPQGARAHALHGDVDAPLPLAAYLLGAAIAVGLSFAFVALSDDPGPYRRPPGRLRTLPAWARLGLRAIGLVGWTWVVLQTIAGGESDAEVASLILWVLGWVGLALVSALLGPAWRWLDPFSTLHDLGAGVLRRLRTRAQRGTGGPETGAPGRESPPTRPAGSATWPVGTATWPARVNAWRARTDAWPARLGAWPAVVGLGVFVWLELAARIGGGRALGLVLIGYTALTLVGMAWAGRDRWRSHAEVFSVWFGLLGRLAPYGCEGPVEEGHLRRRGFGSALAASEWSPSLLGVVTVGAGSVIWDGVSQTQPYVDLVGAPGLVVDSLLLVAFLGVLDWVVLRVARRVGAAATGAGLVPVATGYLVAHYLGFLLTEGQRIVVAASDPLQQGWDLFGTAAWEPRGDVLPTSLLWTLQVGAVVLGHVTGAWLGHAAARQERRHGREVSQWPLAMLMISLTVLALWSLGQNLSFAEVSPGVSWRPAPAAA